MLTQSSLKRRALAVIEGPFEPAGGTMRTCLIAVFVSVILLSRAFADLEFCNNSCQQSQRAALQLLYSQTSGNKWQRTDGWTTSPCGSACDSWPQHCSWSGVHCCLPAGVLGSGSPHFPSNAAVNCTMVGGVVALLLSNQHMHGSLSEEVWPALAGSLKYLDMSGAKHPE